jgi:lysophospholipase L1-like esterase
MTRKVVLRILSILIGLSLGLLLAEIALIFTLPKSMFYRINIESTGGNYQLVDNPNLIYVPVPNTGSFNSYGHRGKAFPFAKGNKPRIVVMGDSVTEGLGVEVGQRFTDILEKSLQGDKEIINLGVCGYSLLQEFEYFKLLGEKFRPDNVLWFITYNDMRLHSGEIYCFNQKLRDARNSAFYETYYKSRIGMTRFMMNFNIYQLIKYAYSFSSQKIFNNNEDEINLDEANNLLKQLNVSAQNHIFKLTFILLPINTKLYASEISDLKYLIDKNNILCLDFRELFVSDSNSASGENYFLEKDPCHYSIRGNKAFADILYQNKSKLGL